MKNEIEHIKNLIQLSNGGSIDIGADSNYSFRVIKAYTEEELLDFEGKNSLTLPRCYRNFLKEVGACEIYSEEESYRLIEFHKLEDSYERYAGCFENPSEWLFKKFLPVGSDNRLQETFGYSFYFKNSPQFFALFHEYYLEELEEEDDPEFPAYLCSLEDYLKEIVNKKGSMEPH